jgi:hypothetical protein
MQLDADRGNGTAADGDQRGLPATTPIQDPR